MIPQYMIMHCLGWEWRRGFNGLIYIFILNALHYE